MKYLPVHNVEIGFRMLLDQVCNSPDREVSPRGEVTREIDTMIVEHFDVADVLLTGVGRKLSPTLAAVEGLQLVGGFSDPEVTVDVAPQYERFRDGDVFHGAYGVRAGDSFEAAVEKLVKDPDTRQSVVTLWRNDLDNEKGKHDYPCSVYVRFAVRDDKLRTTVHMRSNDAWLGYPYDVYQWTLVHRTVADFVGVEPGIYTHIADSFHLYERNFEAVEALLKTPWSSKPRPRLTGGISSNDGTWQSVRDNALSVFNGETVVDETYEMGYLADVMRKYREEKKNG